MSFGGFLVTLPAQLMLFYGMYKLISEAYEKRKRIDKRVKNLRSLDNIYINVSENEKEMLDELTRFNGFKSNSQFIHHIIKQQNRNYNIQ